MKFEVELKDYASGQEDDVHASEIEDLIRELMDDRGDDGVVIVTPK